MEHQTLPEPVATLEVPMADGTRIILRRHGNTEGPRLLLSHGNGLAADFYHPYWSLLTHQFDVILYDLRGHGRNPATPLRTFNIPTLVNDTDEIVTAIDEHFGVKLIVGVCHSLSAMPALMHAAEKGSFAALVLFDPPICPPGGVLEDMESVTQALARRAGSRSNHFETREEFVQATVLSRAFANVPAKSIVLLSQTTLRPAPDGGYQLCLPREHEAQLYEYYFGWSMQAPEILERVDCPTKVIGADPTIPFTYLPSTDLSEMVKLDYDFIPGSSHFLQFEYPETCANLTTEFLENHGFA